MVNAIALIILEEDIIAWQGSADLLLRGYELVGSTAGRGTANLQLNLHLS